MERLVLVLDGAMKRAEIQQALGQKHRDNFRDGYLLPALAAQAGGLNHEHPLMS